MRSSAQRPVWGVSPAEFPYTLSFRRLRVLRSRMMSAGIVTLSFGAAAQGAYRSIHTYDGMSALRCPTVDAIESWRVLALFSQARLES